jgi:hypothetical protein
MAGKKTSLISGANAKLKINGVTMAYAVDFQYNVSIQTIPVETMGRIEVLANEPIAMSINGSFTVVRYANAAKAGDIYGAAKDGNGIGVWGTEPPAGASAKPSAATGVDQGLSSHVNPSKILLSRTVDIEIFQRAASAAGADSTFIKKIVDARITGMSGSVNKRGILMESFTFVAEMLNDDSFSSAASGEIDLTI